jgi:hypothetical protein
MGKIIFRHFEEISRFTAKIEDFGPFYFLLNPIETLQIKIKIEKRSWLSYSN